MAKVWFSRWPPVQHKIGQIAKIKKCSGRIAQRYPYTKFHWNSPSGYETCLAMDDDGLRAMMDNGYHVIAIAHQRWAKKAPKIWQKLWAILKQVIYTERIFEPDLVHHTGTARFWDVYISTNVYFTRLHSNLGQWVSAGRQYTVFSE
jgi:hypothetical protein